MKDAFVDDRTLVDPTEDVTSAELTDEPTAVTKGTARRALVFDPPTEPGSPPEDREETTTTLARSPLEAPPKVAETPNRWAQTRMGAGEPPRPAAAALVIEEDASRPEPSNSDTPATKQRSARFFVPGDTTKKLDRYELIAEIAAGGMATVFLARLRGAGGFQRLVAIKRLHPHLQNEEDFIQMFLDEARIAAQIHHAHVVPILEIGSVQSGTPSRPSAEAEGYYLVMEYIEGVTLFDLAYAASVRKLPLPRGVALRVVLDTLSGLHAAHELCDANGHHLSVVHRDCSPSNLLVGVDGSTRLTDFGVARAASRLSSTLAGTLKGKVAYMAPEQVRQNDYDRRADLFSMGVVLWELFVGQRLFRADNKAETLKRVLSAPIPRLGELVYGISTPLDAAVARALARDPTQRFQSAIEMAEVLEKAAGVTIASPRQVAEFVQKLFGTEIADRREAIRKWTDAADAERAIDPMDRLRRASRPPMSSAAEIARQVAERRASQPPPRVSAPPPETPERNETTVAAKRASRPDAPPSSRRPPPPPPSSRRPPPPRPSSGPPRPAPRPPVEEPPPSSRGERVQIARIIEVAPPPEPAPRESRAPVLQIVEIDAPESAGKQDAPAASPVAQEARETFSHRDEPLPKMPAHKVSLSSQVVASIEEHERSEAAAREPPPPSSLAMRRLEAYSIHDETVLRPRKPAAETERRAGASSMGRTLAIVCLGLAIVTLALFLWLRYRG